MPLLVNDDRTNNILDYYDSIAHKFYDHTLSISEEKFNRRTINPVISCIEKIANLKKDKTLCLRDLCSGPGHWLYETLHKLQLDRQLEQFEEVVVLFVDISPKMLELAEHLLKYKERYKNLRKLRDEGKLRFEYINIDVRKLDEIERLESDLTFYHKALSMIDPKDAEKIFLELAKDTHILLTAVKSKTCYTQKLNDYVDARRRRNESIDLTETEDYYEVKIPMRRTTMIIRKLKEFSFTVVNDDARSEGKKFFEYTYSSSDLEYLYKSGGFRIFPSYNEAGVRLKFVGKPRVELSIHLPPEVEQEWSPIIQTVGVLETSPYASLFPL